MSSGQKPRRPQFFPHMKYRARKRRARFRCVLVWNWTVLDRQLSGATRWIPFAEILERGL